MRAVVVAVLLLPALSAGTAQAQETVTVFPSSPQIGSAFPFGVVSNPSTWTPHNAFFYKNVPAFDLKPGDVLAFDLRAVNDVDIELELSLAAATVNGGTVEAQPFQTVVTNAQTPANPRGDTTVGSFELRFTAESAFSFPGGGLIIRASNPSGGYQLDNTGTPVLVGAGQADASGFFVQRAYRDVDGVSPWQNEMPNAIAAFQVTTFPLPDTTITSAPPDKTRRRTATFGFTGTDVARGSARAVARFECQLDAGTFTPCTSPVTYRVKKGVHTFEVQAIDEHGNTDATPASDTWKRKRKKKK